MSVFLYLLGGLGALAFVVLLVLSCLPSAMVRGMLKGFIRSKH